MSLWFLVVAGSGIGCVVINNFAGLLFDGQVCPHLKCFLHAHLT